MVANDASVGPLAHASCGWVAKGKEQPGQWNMEGCLPGKLLASHVLIVALV